MSQESVQKNTRPPIVVVMGHIDHGKTKILDWYRKTKVAEQESGGITQHIGAYEVRHHGKKITFIDTPGHEAFSKMRSRGATVADIAIVVVAADEGLKPQTKEALEIVQKNNLPFVVALNKIDKSEANTERVKKQLAEEGILVESYGGKVPSVEISAKTGEKMDDLLEIILLLADLEHLEATPAKPGEGVIVESHVDSRRGITSTLLLRDGVLKKGDIFVVGNSVETVKILEDFRGHILEEAGPSTPLRVIGLRSLPAVGETFRVFATIKEAEEFAKSAVTDEKPRSKISLKLSEEEERPVFNLIVKADVAGSKEVLEESLKKIESENIGVNILKSDVGDINESDVKLATATKLVTIVGFKVKIDPSARDLVDRNNIRVVTGEVIYEVLDKVREKMQEMVPPVINRLELGKVKILKVFRKDGVRQIIGGRVEDGVIKRGVKFDIKRMKEAFGSGTITELQRAKQSVDEAPKGSEFGISVESRVPILEGDVLDIYQEEVIKRTL